MSTKLYKQSGIDALVNLLEERIGEQNIISPNEYGDSKYEYKINKTALCKLFYDEKIKNHNFYEENFIRLSEFINYIQKMNKSDDTMGYFHEYMDYLHALYEVNIRKNEVISLPDYHKLTEEVKNIVIPKRDEFLFVWWILKNIRNHPFLKKFEKIINITYQESIRDSDRRFFDVLFKNINIILEVQEAKGNHDDNLNDLTKEGMARLRVNRIYYFKICKFIDENLDYLNEFWYGREQTDIISNKKNKCIEGFETMLIQGLLAYDYDNKYGVITEYLLYETNNFNLKMKLNIKKNMNKLKCLVEKDSIEKYNYLKQKYDEIDFYCKKNNKTQIDILFGWYKKCFNDCDQYLINPNEEVFNRIFPNIIQMGNNKLSKFLKLCIKANYCGLVGETIFNYNTVSVDYDDLRLSWNGLISIFLNPNDEINKKILEIIVSDEDFKIYSRYMLDQLLSIERTYKKIIFHIGIHNKERISNSEILQDQLENHIKNKLIDEYEKKINKLQNLLDIKEEELKFSQARSRKIVKKSDTLNHKVKMAFINFNTKLGNIKKKYPKLKVDIPKEVKEQICSIESDVKDLLDYKKGAEQYTINLIEKDKSIIKEINNFGIIYTDNIQDKISYKKFIAYCDFKNIPKRISNFIVSELSIVKYKVNPSNIFRLKFVNNDEFDFNENQEEKILDSDDEIDSDSESNTEVDDSDEEINELEKEFEDNTVDFWTKK